MKQEQLALFAAYKSRKQDVNILICATVIGLDVSKHVIKQDMCGESVSLGS